MRKLSKVFLGGTCAGSTWRDELIPILEIDYFNPVVEDWTPECQAKEEFEKLVKCDIHLFVITSAMVGVFIIAEVIDSIHEWSKFTVLHIMPSGFDEKQMKSLEAVVDMVKNHSRKTMISDSIEESAKILNNFDNEEML